jgi:hypothetical protein
MTEAYVLGGVRTPVGPSCVCAKCATESWVCASGPDRESRWCWKIQGRHKARGPAGSLGRSRGTVWRPTPEEFR